MICTLPWTYHALAYPRTVASVTDVLGRTARVRVTLPVGAPIAANNIGLELVVHDATGTLLVHRQLEPNYTYDVLDDVEIQRVAFVGDSVVVEKSNYTECVIVALP